jgi:hypothetical protein
LTSIESPKANINEASERTTPEEETHTEDSYEHVEEVEAFTTREVPVEETTTPVPVQHQEPVVKQPEEQPSTNYEEESSAGIGTVKLSYASIVSSV